ncbi:O-antigen polymerase [Streptococcus porcinus]
MKYIFIMVLLTIFFILITMIKYKTLLKPNMLFTFLWLLGSIAVNNNFVGLHNLSDQTNNYLVITLGMFNIFYLFLSKSDFKKFQLSELIDILNLQSHWGKIVIVNFSLIVITFPYFIKMILVFFTKSFYDVRVAAFTYTNSYDLLMSKVVFILMFSFFNLLLIITCLKIVIGDLDIKLFYIMIFDVLYFTLISGSRNFLAKFFVFLFIAFLFSNTHLLKKIHISPKLVTIGAIVLLILDRAIKARSLSSLSPLENIVIYQIGGISYFDHIIHSNEFLVLNQVRLYGLGIFSWLISPILYILSILNFIPNITAESIIGQVTANGIYISSRFNFNALTTAMYPMWRDFGTLGIIIGMSLFGLSVAISENAFNLKRDLKNLLIFFTFFIAVYESTQLYDMLYIRFSMQILWIYFLFGKTHISIKVKE